MRFLKLLRCLFAHRMHPTDIIAERVYAWPNHAPPGQPQEHCGWRFRCIHCDYTWLEPTNEQS